jgi:hypothetical protein
LPVLPPALVTKIIFCPLLAEIIAKPNIDGHRPPRQKSRQE